MNFFTGHFHPNIFFVIQENVPNIFDKLIVGLLPFLKSECKDRLFLFFFKFFFKKIL